ncbi:MAG: DNA-directed RNA polymerase subunit K, partial [Nitrosopumilus sp.]
MSDTEKIKVVESPETEVESEVTEENTGLTKALDTYRKLYEKKGADPLSEKELDNLQKRIDSIESREVVDKIV